MTDAHELKLEKQISGELVDRIANGDRDAEDEFCSRYYQRLFYFIRKRTGGDTPRAQDICQQAFLKCLEKLRDRDIRSPESLAAYLHGIALHDLRNESRKSVRQATTADMEIIENAANQQPSPLEQLSKAQISDAVMQCLDGLSASDRDVLIRLYLRDETRASICASEGYSATQLNNIVWRAKQRLRKQFLEGPAHDEQTQFPDVRPIK